MADKESGLTLSDLIAPRSDSMEQGYKDVAQARDDASSPTAQLIARRKALLVKEFKPDPKAAPVKPEAGIVAPGAESDARGVPAAPGEEKKGGLGHVESKGKEVPLPPPGTMPGDRVERGRDILPSTGEALKVIPGGVLMAAKRLGASVRDLAAAAHAAGVSESAQELEDRGVSPEQAKSEAADSDPLGSVFIKVLTRASEAVPQTGEPESILGGFFKEAVSFLAPFLPFAKIVRAIPEMQVLMKGGPAAKSAGMALEGVIAGLPAGFISVESSNPANLVNALPEAWRPAALEFLAAPPLKEGEEIALEQRFRERLKSSVVSAVAGAPLDMAIGALIAARQALRLKAASRNFDASVKTALGLQEQRAGERAGAKTAEQAAGPLAHDRRKVTMPAPIERRGAVAPAPEIQAVERSMAGQPADKIEAAINRRTGVPDQSITAQVQATIKDGGATFDPRAGTPAPYGDKFVVSNTRGGAMRTPISEFSSSHVAAFRAAHADELLDPDAFHGTWIKEGTVYQDVSRRVSTVEEAQKIAGRADEPQQMIWDEANNVGIPVSSIHVPGDPTKITVSADVRAAFYDEAPAAPARKFNVAPVHTTMTGRPVSEMLAANPGSEVLGAADASGKVVGTLWVQQVTGGFRVLDVRAGRGSGAARELYRAAFEKYGPYKGSNFRTDAGEGLVARLRETDPDIFGVVPPKTDFINTFIRQLADSTGVSPAQMQIATEIGATIERELGNEFAPLREAVGRQARRAFEDGALDVPKDMRNDAGFAKVGLLWLTSRAVAGALYGSSGEGRTLEDRIAGGLVGAGAASAMSPKLVAQLVKKMAGSMEKEVAKRVLPVKPDAAGLAGQPVKPEAHTFGSLADEYAERVRQATRGEEVNPETGLTTVRPKTSQAAEAEIVRQQMTPESIQQLMPTIRMNDSESIAMAQVMNEVGLRVRNLAITAKQGGYQEADVQELLKEIYLMGRMDPKRLGALAEAGRTLGALNDPVSGMNQFLDQFTEVLKNANSTVTPQRLAEAIASLKTPEELAVFARQLTKPGFKDFFFEVWINGLLSGPKTLLVNGLGNTTFLLYNIGERSLAAGIRSTGGVAPGEATAMLEGIVEAHGDALRAFWRLVRDVDEIPDASKLDQPRKAITAENLNLTGTPGRAIDLLGSGIRTPGRVLAGTDEYFKGVAARAQLRALAKREAFNEVERLGLTGRAALDKMNEIETAFLLDPPLSAMQQARSFAEYVTFTTELGETGKALQALQRTAIGRTVIPFVKTPINLAKTGLERSGPLGLASSRLRAELRSSDPAVRDLARAKLALSSMTLAFIGTLAAKGYVTGGGPQDPTLRKQWQAAGYQPYSFDVGAMLGRVGPPKPGDLVSFSRLDPIAMPFGMMADVVTIMGHLPPDEQEEFATAIVVAFSKNFTSKTFVQGVARATSVMADPERMGDSYVKNFLTSATIPFSSLTRQAAQALDPELKDAQDLIEEYKKRIPGLSQDVPADLDLFGNPRFLGGGLGRDLVGPTFQPAVDFVVPIYVNSASKAHQDIFAVLNANSIRAAEAPESIDGVRLSNVERAHLKKIAGQEIAPEGMTMAVALKKLFASPAFKAAAPGRGEGREALVNLVIRGYYKGAVEVLQDRFRDLKRDVMRARVDRLRSMGADPKNLERVRTQIGID